MRPHPAERGNLSKVSEWDKERKSNEKEESVMKKTTQENLWATTLFGKIGATLKSLQSHGVTLEHLARLRAEPKYAKRVAEYILRDGVDDSVHHKFARARALIGKNFFGFGIEDWATLYGANFSQKQLRQVAEFPWGEDVLASTCPLCGKTVKDCHSAFLGLDRLNGEPLTILKFQEPHPSTAQPRFYCYTPDAWYFKEKFATETTCDPRWYLLHTSIVPKSENKLFDEQKAMLPAEYEVPSAIAEVSKDLLVFKSTGVYANPSRYGRCMDVGSDGSRVRVGCFDADGLNVSYCRDDDRYDIIGVSASRKF